MYAPDYRHTDKCRMSIDNLPQLVVGAGTVVPTLHGPKRYINFDNAASTPTLQPTADAVAEFLRWYANVHRGTGFKSQLSSWAYEKARDIVAEFVGADLRSQIVIFTKNTTEAINKLARRMNLSRNDVVLTTLMEHHSNELPWRRVATVVHVALNDDGTLDRDDFQRCLHEYGAKIRLLAITGASNVTGYINDLDYFAREMHRIGARIMVDGAQLVPHRPVNMKPSDPDHRLDFLVFSAHKMYAPFGVGVIVSDRRIFEEGDPVDVGGGAVDIVNLEEAYWTDLPDKEEAGTPDIVGVVALGHAIRLIQEIGWDEIVRHESDLTAFALSELAKLPGVSLYGDLDPANAAKRLGVISFNVKDLPHGLTAAILSYEGAIGVRPGCFCAHTYVKALLKVTPQEARAYEQRILNRDRSAVPGAVRASFGIYNTKGEIETLVDMVRKIAQGEYRKDYVLNVERGVYSPAGVTFDFERFYRF
jgi:cysteine desulfurase / selenocysteine lyase